MAECFAKIPNRVRNSIILYKTYATKVYEAPRSKAAGVSHDSMCTEVAVGMPCPSRSRAAGYKGYRPDSSANIR